MSARRIDRFAVPALVLCLSASEGQAFVQRRAASGAPCHWRSPGAISYTVDRVGSRDIPSDGGRDQVRLAFTWWSMDPGSTLRMTAAPGPPSDIAIAEDGVNAVAWIEDPDFEGLAPDVLGSTRMYVDVESGEIYEADIWLNGVSFTWSPLWSDAPYAGSGPAHVQAVMTHLVGLFVGLDHSVDRDATMYPILPVGPSEGIHIRPDEEAAVRAIYPAAGASAHARVSGRVSRAAGPIEGAYVSAHEVGSGASYGAITDASGSYTIHVSRGGEYRIRVQPYTTDARITMSPFYQALPPSSIDFLAMVRPASMNLVAGQHLSSVDFAVSSSGSIDDSYEPDGAQALARPIATDGTAQLHHTWSAGDAPAYDEDWTWFVSQPGHLYVIDTALTGHSIAGFGAAAPPFARTRLRLQHGVALLAENDSRDPLAPDARSRIAFFEAQGSRTLSLRASMRDADSIGAGYYYDLAVTDIPLPLPQPYIDAVLPSAGSYLGGYVVVLRGSGFVPGAQVTFGGLSGVVQSVDDCDARYSCAAIRVQVPRSAIPRVVDVIVTNPGGRAATVASAFTYLSSIPGVFEDGWDEAFDSMTPYYLGYGQAACFGDFDNDGWVDLFRGANPPPGYPGNLLLHNRRGDFADVTSAAFEFLPSAVTSCAWGDYDNDGLLDLIVVNNGGANQLYHNDGNGTFSQAWTGSTGGLDATWLDYDHDGCLDLFVAHSFPDGNNALWRGRCDGSFVDVASGMGLAVNRHTARVLIRDFNGDGWDDIYLANWSAVADTLYYNREGSSFLDATAASGIEETRQCADVKAADLNGDGAADILCSGDTRGADNSIKPPLWINDGAGHFANRAPVAGLWGLQRYCNALTLFDRDNDGHEDVYLGCERAYFPPHASEELDVLLLNDGAVNPKFTDVTLVSGISEYRYPRTAWATAAADVDSDGDTDIYVTGDSQSATGVVPDDSDYYWRGTTNAPWERAPVHDWIKIRLRGAMRPTGTAHLSPAWGEGATVTVVYDLQRPGSASPSEGECLARPIPTEVRALTKEMVGGSHGQNQLDLHFGLGAPRPADFRHVDCVIVEWPSGLRRAYTRLAVNSYVELTETEESLSVLSVTPGSGPTGGGTLLQLAGFNFAPGAGVLIGNVQAATVSVVSEHLITCAAPPHPPGLVRVTVVNPDGISDTIVDGYAYLLPPGGIEVVDPNPSMLLGPNVSSTPAVLASTLAPGVFGLAADGITPVVVRLPVPAAGLVDFAIFDEARRTTNIGALRAPGSAVSGPTVTVSTTPIGTQQMGIAILTAPSSFRRDAGDDSATLRSITIEATFRPATGGSTRVTSTFYIARPPILLLHGIWSEPATWEWGLLHDPRFVVHAHGYERTSDRSFRENRWVPAQGAREALERFRSRGLAGTKVAVFGHSMGGMLGRIHASGLRTDYRRDDNLGGGDFYFLVTVDAAHQGSPVADFGMTVRDASALGREFEVGMDRIGMNIRNGAAWDLQTSSYETTHLPAVELPVHAFVSVGGSDLLETAIDYAQAAPAFKAALVTLELFGFDLDAGFPPGLQHDFLVGRPSQEGGLARTTLFHYVDVENKAIHFDSVTRESFPNDRAITLMNTPLDDDSVWAPGLPAASAGTTSIGEGSPMRRKGGPRMTVASMPAATVAITAPAPNSLFRQGDTVLVVAQAGGGFVPLRMGFFAAHGDSVVLKSAPWSATLRIGQDAVGPSTIRVIAVGANDVSVSAEIPIRVASSGAQLLGLTALPDEVLLFEGRQQQQLRVRGSYADGIDRTVTLAATGTTYDSQDPTVVTVSGDGIVTGHAIGSTSVVVRNGSKQATVAVRVKSLPMALTFADKATLAWPRNPGAVGYDIVSGNLSQLRAGGGNFASAVTACVARNTPGSTASVGSIPGIGNGFFYLLRYRRPGGPASYDEFPDWMGNQVGKRDAEVAASAGSCAP